MELFLVVSFFFGVVVVVVRRRPHRRYHGPQEPQKRDDPTTSALPRPIPAPRQPIGFHARTSRPRSKPLALSGSAWVVDGDTITIQKTQIRLFGIDAPELNHPYGKKAKWALHSLCKGHVVRAEIVGADDYGRTVGRCYLADGRDLSAEMVKLGMALDWAKFSNGTYRALETPDARRKLFLADARQKGRMDIWQRFEAAKGGK